MESLHVRRKKTSRIFHYFSKNDYNEILFYNGEREEMRNNGEKREEKGGRGFHRSKREMAH